jgi:hypothetical protein
LRLTIHAESAQVRPTTTGIPFLGFTVFPTHRLLKQRKGIAFQRKWRGLLRDYIQGKISLTQLYACTQGWVNHVRYADTWGLRRALFRTTFPGWQE